MLTTGSHSFSGFLFCEEGVYLMYTTEEQDEKRPGYANQWQLRQVQDNSVSLEINENSD